uniref:DUF4283 domain-containing protein n=1 Tax=Solanum tuberosum TaxID=4113 RepID=M1DBH8_SOLTU
PKMQGETPISVVELKDSESEIKYWKTVVVCYVLGPHPPFVVVNGYVQRIWSKHGINKVLMLKNGIILVQFDIVEAKNEEGISHFDNKPFIVKSWNPDMEYTKDELNKVPIWFKLPDLDFKYWNPKGLSKLGSLVGKPLMVDHFARLLVEVQMDSKLPNIILFKNERDLIVE